jgi:hypothetical protein
VHDTDIANVQKLSDRSWFGLKSCTSDYQEDQPEKLAFDGRKNVPCHHMNLWNVHCPAFNSALEDSNDMELAAQCTLSGDNESRSCLKMS